MLSLCEIPPGLTTTIWIINLRSWLVACHNLNGKRWWTAWQFPRLGLYCCYYGPIFLNIQIIICSCSRYDGDKSLSSPTKWLPHGAHFVSSRTEKNSLRFCNRQWCSVDRSWDALVISYHNDGRIAPIQQIVCETSLPADLVLWCYWNKIKKHNESWMYNWALAISTSITMLISYVCSTFSLMCSLLLAYIASPFETTVTPWKYDNVCNYSCAVLVLNNYGNIKGMKVQVNVQRFQYTQYKMPTKNTNSQQKTCQDEHNAFSIQTIKMQKEANWIRNKSLLS